MIFTHLLIHSTLISSLHSLANPPAQAPIQSSSEIPQLPTSNLGNAEQNAPQIFNAIHAAARQWGSSLSHNGMSFFPASIPANTHLYHGSGSNVSVTGMEWLAFEIEHAEAFARPRRGRPPKPPPNHGGPTPRPPHWEELRLRGMRRDDDHDDDDGPDARGYLHIYKTKRELRNLLYIDGMSAGKTMIGTLDSQDLILRSTANGIWYRDYERASELCALGKDWGVEGFVRMEMGFELIVCDFEDVVDVESVRQRSTDLELETLTDFEVLRGASLRYHGIGAGRLRLDYSRMVSVYWYGLNLTNPDGERADVPRLPVDDEKRLERVKDDVVDVVREGWGDIVDWQGVVDMIVLRYADRLKLMAGEETGRRALETEIGVLLNVFIDYKEVDIAAAAERCAVHYLGSAILRTSSDFLIYASLLTITSRICNVLFSARKILLRDNDEESLEDLAVKDVKSKIRHLVRYLKWSRWLECGMCADDEICFVAIWPWGSKEDHLNPSCLWEKVMHTRNGYWGFRGSGFDGSASLQIPQFQM